MNKDIMLGILIGVILTFLLVVIGGFFFVPRLTMMFGFPGANQPVGGFSQQQPQSQGNGTLFGCQELKLVGAATVKSDVPFMIQNSDSKMHKVSISGTEYALAPGEKKTITISGWGAYHPLCDDSPPGGELNVEK